MTGTFFLSNHIHVLFPHYLLVQLTEEEKSMFRVGSHKLIPNHDRTGRAVAIVRWSKVVIPNDNCKPLARYAWYLFSCVEDDESMQQKGLVTVADYRGNWNFSLSQVDIPVECNPLSRC